MGVLPLRMKRCKTACGRPPPFGGLPNHRKCALFQIVTGINKTDYYMVGALHGWRITWSAHYMVARYILKYPLTFTIWYPNTSRK